jgi:hypothetical protein
MIMALMGPRWRATMIAALCAVIPSAAMADGPRLTFDLPDTIECRDVTPREFAVAHPALKVIEAKLRISARLNDGAEDDIIDFLYLIGSPEKRIKFQDYLPNTTLESTALDDRIEVAETNENTASTNADAKVSYKVLSLGGSISHGSKKTESNHYKQIAPKALVLASGTTDREHGIFFKLRPSKGASLEGAKEFTFLATVPRSWRGDWCMVSCAARFKAHSFLSRGAVTGSAEQAQIGMYLAGDAQAAALAEELRRVQDVHSAALAEHMTRDEDHLLDTMYAAVSTQAISSYTTALCAIFKGKKGGSSCQSHKRPDSEQSRLEDAQQAVLIVQEQLRRLAQ